MVCRWVQTRARAQLVRYFEARGHGSQRKLASVLGVREQLVWAWRTGNKRPGLRYRIVLERIAGIPRAAWLTPAERAHDEQLERAVSGLCEAEATAATEAAGEQQGT